MENELFVACPLQPHIFFLLCLPTYVFFLSHPPLLSLPGLSRLRRRRSKGSSGTMRCCSRGARIRSSLAGRPSVSPCPIESLTSPSNWPHRTGLSQLFDPFIGAFQGWRGGGGQFNLNSIIYAGVFSLTHTLYCWVFPAGTVWWLFLCRVLPGSSRAGRGCFLMDLL